jgi:hypothetical protein
VSPEVMLGTKQASFVASFMLQEESDVRNCSPTKDLTLARGSASLIVSKTMLRQI